MNHFTFISVLIILVFVASLSLAGIPKMINYQGMLTGPDGKTPVNNGNYAILFSIYNISSGGSSLWSHTYNVSVTNGLFNVILGDSSAPINLPFDTTYWLGIKVGGDPELSPRIRLTSVGYAYRASVADSAMASPPPSTGGGWTDEGTVVRLTTGTDKVGIGTTTPQVKLSLGTDLTPKKFALWDGVDDFYGFGVELGRITAYTNNIEKMTILANGNVGIGTVGPSSKLDVVGDININSSYKIGGNKVLSNPGSGNIFVGVLAGAVNTGTNNTFLGNEAGYSTTTGNANTFLGHEAGFHNTTGFYNTFVGNIAGLSDTSGWENTFLGAGAGQDHTTGNCNTFVGAYAGTFNSTGAHNTFLGRDAGFDNTGSGNVFIGYDAGHLETGSNKLYIANSDINPPLIYGDFATGYVGLGTTNPIRKLHIVGANPRILIEASSQSPEVNFKNSDDPDSAIWALYKHGTTDDFRFYQNGDKVTIQNSTGNVGIGTTDPGSYKLAVNGSAAKTGGGSWDVFSDLRLKEIKAPYEYGLREISQLHPVHYCYKEDNALGLPAGEEFVGLVAQDVEGVIPDAIEENDKGYLMLNNDPIIWAMLNAIKELKAENEELKKRIEALESR
jgi:hypothetical protein